jgi:hypothetical protein
MGYGYSVRLVHLNASADDKLLGVQLGRACIRNNVSVAEVSARLNVSRQTIYSWFCGGVIRKPAAAEATHALIASLG